MTNLEYSPAATKPYTRVKPTRLAVVAAIALSSTVPYYAERSCVRHLGNFDKSICSATANYDLTAFSCDSASTEPRAFTHGEAANVLSQLLTKNGFNPSRIERTADDSVLFQFLGNVKACIDLYPNGELIVIVRQPNQDEVHELQYEDSERVIQLMRNAAITS